jgi:hypothetical protein
MRPKPPNSVSGNSHSTVNPAEARMADLLLQFDDEVSRAKMETFLHFAQDRSKITVRVEPSRDHGLRFILAYPFAQD